jgi:protein ImuB
VVVTGRGEQSAAPARIVCALLPGGGGVVQGWAGPWPSDARWWDPSARQRCARWQILVNCGADAGDVACIVTVVAGIAGIEAIYD